MLGGTELTTVQDIRDDGSYVCTVRDAYGDEDEVIVVSCSDDTDQAVRGWINRCTHEAQRFDTGEGVPMRGGQIICPRHGSLFDACSGECDNGMAADTTLPDVELTIEDGTVYLTDNDYKFSHEGKIEKDDDNGPSSTSHIGF